VWDMATEYMEIVSVGYGYSVHGDRLCGIWLQYAWIVSVGYGYSVHGDR